MASITDSISKRFDLLKKEVYLSTAFIMASRPSHAAMVFPSIMLNLYHMFSIIMITCRITEGLLLYATWSSGCPGVVLVAVILR